MKNKKSILYIFALALLAAGCNPFAKPLPAGVLKSVDGGVDWQFSNAIASSTTASLTSLDIAKLAFDPQNRQTVFAGSYTGGLYESSDAAATWTPILSKIYVYDFAVDPTDSKTIYAAGLCPYTDAEYGCVLKTTDGGASWQNDPGYKGSDAADAVRAIAINPLSPNQIVIGTGSGAVIKSADGGNTWQLANNFKDQVNRILWQGSNIYVLLKDSGLFTSADFGQTFTALTGSLAKAYNLGSVSYSINTISTFSQVYVDTDSPQLIYLTTDKGLYKTTDGGTSWTAQSLPTNVGTNSPRAIAVSQTSSDIVFTSVGSTIYKSVDGGSTWQTQGVSTAGFINYILIDPQLPQVVYAGVYGSQ